MNVFPIDSTNKASIVLVLPLYFIGSCTLTTLLCAVPSAVLIRSSEREISNLFSEMKLEKFLPNTVDWDPESSNPTNNLPPIST